MFCRRTEISHLLLRARAEEEKSDDDDVFRAKRTLEKVSPEEIMICTAVQRAFFGNECGIGCRRHRMDEG